MHRRRDKDPNTRPQRPPKGKHDSHRASRQTDETLSVRLTRKFADVIDGVNLTDAHVGDRLELSQRDAEVLIAEGWAEPTPRRSQLHKHPRAQAADKPRRKKTKPR